MPRPTAEPAGSISRPPGAYYNDHLNAIIEDCDRNEYGAVLRQIERHVVEWERQQTPEQAIGRVRRRNYQSPRALIDINEAVREAGQTCREAFAPSSLGDRSRSSSFELVAQAYAEGWPAELLATAFRERGS